MSQSDFQSSLDEQQRKVQRRTWALSPEERLARFVILQATAEQVLASNPSALAAFHQRNRRQRTESRVRQLELQLRLVDRDV